MIRTADFIKALELRVLVPTTHEEMPIDSADINRPGLQLAGFYENFANKRPQVIGKAEMSYLDSLDNNLRLERLRTYFSYPIPCVIISRGMQPPEELLQLAREKDVPVLQSDLITTRVFINVITYLRQCLAPRTTMHGVLLDVFGVGVLITGRSGVGKSEAALELIKRGHQLVADDVVDICKVTDDRLIGESPEMVRHLMEIRGIGIIDIKAMFGIGSVLMSKSIDLVVHLEKWEEQKEYDRFGLNDEYTSIMDVRLPRIVLPIKPGRNLAIIIEVAARNFSLKRMGYSAAQELDRRTNEMMQQKMQNRK
ncbi:MAG: HPr kinase/phosphorylase [Clostridia bacterium]|jgi:HPr kinase/phosphorylase|nr:HPr kinase/phosphorylase [Clostridia bacterium]MBR6300797.1 HPr kinase/phosphorylase [Clostridia bacterium]